MERTITALGLINPESLSSLIGAPVFLSASLAFCLVNRDDLVVCSLIPEKKYKTVIITVPGGGWNDEDTNIIITAAREFVEEVYGDRNPQREEFIVNLLWQAWLSDSETAPYLSVEIDSKRNRGYDDLNVHIAFRYLLDYTNPVHRWLIDDINAYGHGCDGKDKKMEKTTNIGWRELRSLIQAAPRWYKFGFSRDGVTNDRIPEWKSGYRFRVEKGLQKHFR